LVRDAAHAPALDSVLATSSKHPHEAISIDLTDLDSVRKAAEAINLQVSEGKIPQIRALVLNAGFQDFGKQTWTKDGFDTMFRDKDNFEAIAKGKWSSAIEDTTWRSGFRRYGAAKLCLTMMMHELQHRMNTDPQLKNVCILGVDPGAMSTGLQRHASWFIRV